MSDCETCLWGITLEKDLRKSMAEVNRLRVVVGERPRASDHRFACTGSNEAGQFGSHCGARPWTETATADALMTAYDSGWNAAIDQCISKVQRSAFEGLKTAFEHAKRAVPTGGTDNG